MPRRLSCLTVCLLLAWLAGCSGGAATPVTQPAADSGGVEAEATVEDTASQFLHEVTMQPQAIVEPTFRTTSLIQPMFLDLDFPATRGVSDTGEIITVAASGYDTSLPSRHVAVKGGYTLFEPEWSSDPSHTMDDAAWCAYTIDLTGYKGGATVSIVWADSAHPDVQEEYWVGLANYEENTWDFFEGPLDQVLTLDSLEPYTSPTGRLVVVPIITWIDRVVILEELKVGAAEVRATGLVEGEVNFNSDYPDFYCPGLPGAVDLTPECAPVGDQRTWGACMVFGIVNGVYNQELNRIYGCCGWDPADPANQASPKYIYVETGKDPSYHGSTYTSGRGSGQVLYALTTLGVPTELNAPYDLVYDDDWSAAALADAEVLNIEHSHGFELTPLEQVNSIKHVLAHHGQTVYISMMLDYEFFHFSSGGSVWNYSGEYEGSHGMAVVGYDDALSAFKVRNSWGADWADDGHVWIGYETFENELAYVKAGYLVDDYNPAAARRFLDTELELPPPVSVRATPGARSDAVTVTWDSLADPLYYLVSRDTVDNVIAQAFGRTWIDFTVEDYLSHSYWVRAVYGGGESMPSSPAAGFRKLTAATITSIIPQTSPAGQLVTFEPYIDGTGILEYHWDFGTACTPRYSTEPTPTVLTGNPGEYDIYLTITDDLGSHQFEKLIYIVTGSVPTSSYTFGPDPIWYGTELTFDAGGSGDSGGWIVLYEWDWDGDGGYDEVTEEAVVTHTYQTPGTYAVTLRVTDCEGLTNTKTRDVIILADNNPPVVNLEAKGLDNPSQPPVRVSLDAGDTFDYEDDICLYEWDTDGDGIFDVSEEYRDYTLHTYLDHDRVTVTLRVTDEQGLSAEVTRTLKIGFGETIPGWQAHGITHHTMSKYDLAIDVTLNDGLPGVLCRDYYGRLWLAEADSTPEVLSNWDEEQLLINGLTAHEKASLAYDPQGRPLITYYTDHQNQGLHFGIRNPATGWAYSDLRLSNNDWVGYNNTIAVTDDEIIVCFDVLNAANYPATGLFHARATSADPAGPGDWDCSQILVGYTTDNNLDLGFHGGLPWITYGTSNYSDQRVCFAGAGTSTPAGTGDWTSHYLGDSMCLAGRWSMVEHDGRPLACILPREESGTLRLARAASALPESAADWSWTSLPAPEGYGRQTGLAIVEEIPWAVALTNYEPAGVTVYQSSVPEPATAADWTATTLCTGDYDYCRILAVDGRPAIILYCSEDGCLFYLTPE